MQKKSSRNRHKEQESGADRKLQLRNKLSVLREEIAGSESVKLTKSVRALLSHIIPLLQYATSKELTDLMRWVGCQRVHGRRSNKELCAAIQSWWEVHSPRFVRTLHGANVSLYTNPLASPRKTDTSRTGGRGRYPTALSESNNPGLKDEDREEQQGVEKDATTQGLSCEVEEVSEENVVEMNAQQQATEEVNTTPPIRSGESPTWLQSVQTSMEATINTLLLNSPVNCETTTGDTWQKMVQTAASKSSTAVTTSNSPSTHKQFNHQLLEAVRRQNKSQRHVWEALQLLCDHTINTQNGADVQWAKMVHALTSSLLSQQQDFEYMATTLAKALESLPDAVVTTPAPPPLPPHFEPALL